MLKRDKTVILICSIVMSILYLVALLPADAEQGIMQPKIDVAMQDAPLSYIDKPDYHTPSPADQQRFDITNEYVQAQKANQELHKQQALSQIDDAINTFQQTKEKYDTARKSYRYDPYPYPDPYRYDEDQFSTEIKHKFRYYPYPYCSDPKNTCPNGYMTYQPYLNIFNIPGYLNNYETSYDGHDDDGDHFIDEGFHSGTAQIILGDTGTNKDDIWSLYVDDRYMGDNDYGYTRNWDLHLYPGTHTVRIVGKHFPDNSGNYSIIFRNASVVSGPALSGFDIQQGRSFEWVIKTK